jgi:GDP-4-dehydro-6-deoxy-D-mannose reductase
MNQKSSSRRVLITGVNGFSGRHLAAFLARDPGLAVLGTGRSVRTSVPVAGYRPCDITDEQAIHELVAWAEPDVVYHLAGAWNAATDEALVDVNVRAFERLRDAIRLQARGRRVRVLVVGSAAEIGLVMPEQLPVDESIACHPVTAYGRSKHALVQTALAEPRDSGLEIVVARPFNLIGAGVSDKLAPGRFAAAVRAVARGETDTIHCGWLDGRRDYLDIEDAVRAYHQLMEYAPAGTLGNVCSGRSVRTGELLDRLVKRAGVAPRVVAAAPPRDGDLADIRGSHALLSSMTGWQPVIELDESLTALLGDPHHPCRDQP